MRTEIYTPVYSFGPSTYRLVGKASRAFKKLRPASIPSILINRLAETQFHDAWIQPYCKVNVLQKPARWECYACHVFNAIYGKRFPAGSPEDIDHWNNHCESHAHITAVEVFRKQKMFTIPRFCSDTRCPECQLPMSATTPNFLQTHWETECFGNCFNMKILRSLSVLSRITTFFSYQSSPVYHDIMKPDSRVLTSYPPPIVAC
ncbi:hypothetical protein QCA50_003588 [Cerrena zonata]|uniref:Uncharacterized protein n=1 Tax=Cerrena zonata TaxID=2478898 RepID=A0AAW0GMZ5_9APHY